MNDREITIQEILAAGRYAVFAPHKTFGTRVDTHPAPNREIAEGDVKSKEDKNAKIVGHLKIDNTPIFAYPWHFDDAIAYVETCKYVVGLPDGLRIRG